ncbi:MAG: DNA polymerase II [Pseudomonadales bacterium]|nr:DNA polymerase II [Pseudomonadales bacterium]
MSVYHGVVYQAGYRIEQGRPVVQLYGRLTSGESFLLRDSRETPHFFIPAAQVRKAAAIAHAVPGKFRDFRGSPVARVDVAVPPDVPPLRDRLHAFGIATYEADLRFAMRYLIDRGIRGGVTLHGEPVPGDGVTWRFDDVTVAPGDARILPRVLAFDIETTPKADRLLAISIYGLGADEVAIVDGSRRAMPPHAIAMADERAALNWFGQRLRDLDVDILTGWNVVDFDLATLDRIATRLNVPLMLGRDRGRLRIRAAEGYFGSGQATISGRVVLDGIDLLRGAFVRMDDYSLDAVAREVLGEGKAVHGDVKDRVGEILHNYRHDLPSFAAYARTDARLALEIVDRLQLVDLAFARSRLTGMMPDRVAASIASFDSVYLEALHRRGIVAPTVRFDEERTHTPQAGGQVFEPMTGMHTLVWVFDYRSLYPSIMRTYGIDPLEYVRAEADPEAAAVAVVTGARFAIPPSDEPAILPHFLDQLFPARAAAKARGDGIASQAIKILMNSFYGVVGTPASRFYNPAIANAITGQGRYLLMWSKQWFESAGYTVLYGDTDSLFVRSGLADPDAADALGKTLTERINADLAAHVQATAGVVSKLELEYEKLYARLFLASVRHGTGGARKRYAGIRVGSDAAEFVGMEVVRRDWTDLAKQVQRELYARLFTDEPVAAYLDSVVRDVRAGRCNDLLVYRKGLRKDMREYTASTPPHVVAARKSKQEPGRIIAYVMTTAGPEPLDAITAPYDLDHYVEKQIRPVAEPVLAALGLDFARVIGDDRQLDMF